MEPAVKPAAELTRSGVVGVLATYATFHGAVYNSVVERFAKGVTLLQDHCPGLVSQIEKGDLNGPETRRILEKALLPMLEKKNRYGGAGLYPLSIRHPPDPTDCWIRSRSLILLLQLARQAQRLLKEHDWLVDGTQLSEMQLMTTGDTKAFEKNLPLYLGYDHHVKSIRWQDGRLI